MLNIITRTMVILLLLLLFFSCEESDVTTNYEIVTSDNLKLGENLKLTINEPNKLIKYNWELRYELGNKVTSCDSLLTPEINCSLEESGEVKIVLTAKTRNGEEVVLNKSINILDMDEPLNQAPVIVLSLKSLNGEESIVSTDRIKERGTVNYPVNDEITFDFSQTTDDVDSNSDLKYEIKLGKEEKFQDISSNFKHTFTKTGYFAITLRVTDKNENSAIKNFVIFISCSGNVDLAIDYSKIIITKDAIHNFFTYNASNAVTGGDSSTYRYRWDYNGDGVYDTDWLAEGRIREYTVFKGVRNVKLKVWEQACNNVKEVSLTDSDPSLYDFDIPFADAIAGTLQGPQIPGYYFIQGHPEGKDGFKSTITDVDFIATKAFTAPPEEQWRVICDYRPKDGIATVSIKGLNLYEKEENGKLHGVLLKLDNIDVSDFETLSTTSLSNLDANVNSLSYYSDEEYDKLSRVIYRNDGECESKITVTVTRGEGSCGGAAATFSDVIILDGTYSCENLNGNDHNISFKKGAFYCEVGKTDACYGGGGGGGGNPPEEF